MGIPSEVSFEGDPERPLREGFLSRPGGGQMEKFFLCPSAREAETKKPQGRPSSGTLRESDNYFKLL
jgi:hypothetical protein